MFCTKCGNQIEKDGRFCKSCGCPVKLVTEENAQAPEESTIAPPPASAPSFVGKKKTYRLAVVIAGAACVIAAVVVAIVVVFGGRNSLAGGMRLIYEVTKVKQVDESLVQITGEKILDRLKEFGLSGARVTISGRRLIVEIPRTNDPERAKALVGKTALLQFRLVQEWKPAKEAAKDPAWKETPEDECKKDAVVILPYAKGKDKVFCKLGPTLLTGDIIKKAQVAYEENGDPRIDFTTTDLGKKQFGDVTTANVNKQLAIVLDYVVESAPNIKSAITEGKGQITGKFTEQEAKDIAIVLNIGALPFELKLLSVVNI